MMRKKILRLCLIHSDILKILFVFRVEHYTFGTGGGDEWEILYAEIKRWSTCGGGRSGHSAIIEVRYGMTSEKWTEE
jgi:hypothetical protein